MASAPSPTTTASSSPKSRVGASLASLPESRPKSSSSDHQSNTVGCVHGTISSTSVTVSSLLATATAGSQGGSIPSSAPPSFQSVLASLSSFRPKLPHQQQSAIDSFISAQQRSPSPPPFSAGNNTNRSTSPSVAPSIAPDYSALLKLQHPTIPPPSAVGGSALATSRSPPPLSRLPLNPPSLSDVRVDSLNSLRMKAREHEMRLEMLKKMES